LAERNGIPEGVIVGNFELQSALMAFGKRVPPASQLTLVGGSALMLLGSPRPTLDIDFIGDDIHPNEFHRTIMQIAKELKINVEPVPLERFVPLPKGSAQRSIFIGQFAKRANLIFTPKSLIIFKH
jgi:hypothetical protein